MTAPFSLDKEDVKILLATYERKYQQKVTEAEEAHAAFEKAQLELAEVAEKIKWLSQQLDPPKGTARASFPDEGTWHQKIKFVLDLFGRPMTTSEIVTALEEYMPEWERKKLMTSVSATISASLNHIYTKDNDKVWIK